SILDVLISKKTDGSVAHSVYRKPTHTDRCLELNARSFHPPSVKVSVNRTLLQRAHIICDKEHLPNELEHLNPVLQANGYKPNKRESLSKYNSQSAQFNDMPIAVLPYIGHTSHKIQRILREAEMKVYYRTRNKLDSKLHTHKDKHDSSSQAGVYRIPCTCGKVYIGETGRDLTTRLKEHKAHGRRGGGDRSKYSSGFVTSSLSSSMKLGPGLDTARRRSAVRVYSDFMSALDNRRAVFLVLLDLSAAFDTVDHGVFVGRLSYIFGIGGSVCKWFESYLCNRSNKNENCWS
ncbi:uncharacterized protein, partial [Asterias amurensis]|uniref:uncharacterized protein n=1 Tax=Asterias amurensis TaxID=7602 RepID=UPI003AB62547